MINYKFNHLIRVLNAINCHPNKVSNSELLERIEKISQDPMVLKIIQNMIIIVNLVEMAEVTAVYAIPTKNSKK